ncbi:MAG: tetratricopeptide repeat protein [Planctomycetota bacterium]|nr:tetratricopeptide repeat protein [Planctomycetota bacterium]
MRAIPRIPVGLGLFVLGACLAVVGPAQADMLSLKDGRFITGRPIEKGELGFTVKYEHGDVFVPAALVADYYRSDEAGEFVPTTDEEKAKAEEGLAPWRDGWIKRARRDKLVKEQDAARRTRMEQQQARRKWRDRAIVKTKLFEFHHTLPDDLFQEFQDLFETYYKVFSKEWKIRPDKDFGRVTINIYHDEEYYQQVSGAPSGVVGWYMPANRDLHFFYDRNRHRFTLDVMFHEGNHMLTHMIDTRMWYPAWLGEGMAEYYGASEWNAETKEMRVGGIQSSRLCVLWAQVEEREKRDKHTAWQGLQALIEMDRIGAVEYSWAWSLCHFLLSSEQYGKGFRKFYKDLGTDKKVKRVAYGPFVTVPAAEQIELLLKSLKVKSIEALEKEWHDYIRKELALDLVDLDYAGAGWIMSLYGERKKAEEFFEKAVAAGEQSGYVYYSYGKLLYDQGQRDRAGELIQKALDVDPFHARAWMTKGLCHIRKGRREEGLKFIDLAMEIDPDDTEIWLARIWEEERVEDGR